MAVAYAIEDLVKDVLRNVAREKDRDVLICVTRSLAQVAISAQITLPLTCHCRLPGLPSRVAMVVFRGGQNAETCGGPTPPLDGLRATEGSAYLLRQARGGNAAACGVAIRPLDGLSATEGDDQPRQAGGENAATCGVTLHQAIPSWKRRPR